MNRIDEIIRRVENDEPVNWEKENLLVALDMVKLGGDFVKEMLERERKSDDMATDDEKVKTL